MLIKAFIESQFGECPIVWMCDDDDDELFMWYG